VSAVVQVFFCLSAIQLSRCQMPYRVLVADDNAGVRRAIRWYLEQRTAVEVCAEAENGLEAVDKALALKPDLLILDVGMPGLNGIEASGVLKKKLPEAKIVLFTIQRQGGEARAGCGRERDSAEAGRADVAAASH
jgi:CheY-like chemotaxis protein